MVGRAGGGRNASKEACPPHLPALIRHAVLLQAGLRGEWGQAGSEGRRGWGPALSWATPGMRWCGVDIAELWGLRAGGGARAPGSCAQGAAGLPRPRAACWRSRAAPPRSLTRQLAAAWRVVTAPAAGQRVPGPAGRRAEALRGDGFPRLRPTRAAAVPREERQRHAVRNRRNTPASPGDPRAANPHGAETHPHPWPDFGRSPGSKCFHALPTCLLTRTHPGLNIWMQKFWF